jgi:uncharacterized protein YndB with AHSA1/START domain
MSDHTTTGSASIQINASPSDVFRYLTNLELLPGLSPENVRCEFLDDSTELRLGSRFRGHNKSGGYEWHADCLVIEFDPNRSFAYEVPPGFEHATVWSYAIEPAADGSSGCTVTESFDAPLLALPDLYPGKIEGRRDNLEKACRTTLANLKDALES